VVVKVEVGMHNLVYLVVQEVDQLVLLNQIIMEREIHLLLVLLKDFLVVLRVVLEWVAAVALEKQVIQMVKVTVEMEHLIQLQVLM
tara:strand:- start:144 stop:401 length:258 start_codon:yes stop_codon:yes gene_type:complete